MCGICGIVNFEDASSACVQLVRRMTDQLIHRGPDDCGFHSERGVALGFRRLSIIDLKTGDQPLANEDGTVWAVFNGEIYNYRNLRKELEKAGHHFRTRSDSETIVHAYEEYGLDFVKHLRGMFAIGLWDARLKRLVLVRDRLGKKPLYYYRNAKHLLFASELKALLQSPDVPRELDPVAVDEYLTFHYVPAPRTILRSVRKLEPGHMLVVNTETGYFDDRRYWNLEYEPKLPLDEAEASAILRDTLTEAVRLRLVSDVPLGALLSGGIDSSIVVGLMSQASSEPVKTFTIGFDESAYNELQYAREISQRFGTDHHEFMVRPDALALADKIVYYLDEPMGDSSAIPTYYVSQMARQHVTVVLNGDGGDEAFGGYNHYASVLQTLRWEKLPRWFVHGLRPFLNRWPKRLDYRRTADRCKTFADIGYMPLADQFLRQVTTYPSKLRRGLYTAEMEHSINGHQKRGAEEHILSLFEGNNGMGPLDQMLRADTKTLLPGDFLVKMDRMSMAHSLEARSPFLDHEVVEFAARLPESYKRKGNDGKLLLKRAFADLLPNNIRRRKKQGFGIPLDLWFRQELSPFAHDILLGQRARERSHFKPEAVKTMLDEHQAGFFDHSARLWTLLVLEVWQRQYIDVQFPQLLRN
jgi:asparagine synthase (glutamine-hydrolysing)